MRCRPKILAIVLATHLLAGCGGLAAGRAIQLQAYLEPVGEGKVSGMVTFQEIDAGVLVEATVTGLARGGHAFHIHENGDCANPGGHFDPRGAPHARWDVDNKHIGDLPMLVADATGRAYLNAIVLGPSARSGRNVILGRAVIVHERRDNYFTQPDGDAGAAVACGIIRRP